MRLKVKDKLVLTEDSFEDALDVPVKGLTYEDSYFRFVRFEKEEKLTLEGL